MVAGPPVPVTKRLCHKAFPLCRGPLSGAFGRGHLTLGRPRPGGPDGGRGRPRLPRVRSGVERASTREPCRPRKAAAVLTGTQIDDLIEEARANRTPARDVSVGGCAGATLRLTPTAAVYSMRFRHAGEPLRIRLGDAGDWTPVQVRSAGAAVRARVGGGAGVPAPAWIALKRSALVAKAARGEAVVVQTHMPKNRAPKTWTYRQARDAWVAHLEAEAESPAQIYRPDTVRNYRSVIGCPAMRALDDRFVSRSPAPDVAEAVAGLVREGKRSQARDVVRGSKRFWAWMAEPGQVRLRGLGDLVGGAPEGGPRCPDGAGPVRRSPRRPSAPGRLASRAGLRRAHHRRCQGGRAPEVPLDVPPGSSSPRRRPNGLASPRRYAVRRPTTSAGRSRPTCTRRRGSPPTASGSSWTVRRATCRTSPTTTAWPAGTPGTRS